MSKTIEHVGYSINPPKNIIEEYINSILGSDYINKYNVELKTTTIILSNKKNDTQKNMLNWYKSKKGNLFDGIIKKIWIIKKPYVIICQVKIDDDYFYSVVSKPNTYIQKAGLKKEIIAGKHGKHIDCNIDVKISTYIYLK